MASVKENLKSLPTKTATEQDIISDIRYIRKACSLVTESLKKGCEVVQYDDGDITVTEIRTVSFNYTWDASKGKFVKVKSGSRLRKLRRNNLSSNEGGQKHANTDTKTKERTLVEEDA